MSGPNPNLTIWKESIVENLAAKVGEAFAAGKNDDPEYYLSSLSYVVGYLTALGRWDSLKSYPKSTDSEKIAYYQGIDDGANDLKRALDES